MRDVIAVAAFAALPGVCAASVTTQFTFDSLVHGEILDGQFEPALSVTGVNPNRPFDLIAGFDTTLTGTADPDLEGPPPGAWDGGNLAPTEILNRVLIIAENNTGAGDGILDNPDDEASRPNAGTISLQFGGTVDSFGFDVIDIEGALVEQSSLDFYAFGVLVTTVSFADFVDNSSSFFQTGVDFGDNHANRISPLTALQLGGTFDRVDINFGGSAAIDNVIVTSDFPIPAPTTAAALGVAGMLAGRRRR